MWYKWFHSIDFLLLDFPLYHLLMLILVCVAIWLLWDIRQRVRFICQLIGRCPFCHKDTLYTTQKCLNCGGRRQHANRLPGEER